MIDKTEFDIAQLRREYTSGGLRRHNLTADPLDLFSIWLKQAYAANITDPTAMCVATVDQGGQPYQRIVLLKHYDQRGMTFYTNMESRKARQLANNACISLLFPWHMLDRQVAVLGKVEKLSVAEILDYFHSRPRESQIAAWASQQSTPLASRSQLEKRFLQMEQKFQQQPIPPPDYWGGFRVIVDSIEFWQGGEHRLHDRFIYRQEAKQWNIERLSP